MMEQQSMMGMGGDPNDPNADPNAMGEDPNNPGAPDQNVPDVGGRSGKIKEKQPGSAEMDAPANETLKYIDKLLLSESNVDKVKIWKNIKLKASKAVKS